MKSVKNNLVKTIIMLINIVLFLCDESCSYYLDIMIDFLCPPYIMVLWIIFKSTFPFLCFKILYLCKKQTT